MIPSATTVLITDPALFPIVAEFTADRSHYFPVGYILAGVEAGQGQGSGGDSSRGQRQGQVSSRGSGRAGQWCGQW